MKNLTKHFFLIVIVALLYSCTNDKDIKGKIFVKMIETTIDNISETSVFKYYENQLISSENSKQKIEYSYVNGLITRIVSYNKGNQLSTVVDYSYVNGKLTQVTSSENYVIYYKFNTDGTILYEKYNGSAKIEGNKIHHGVLYFKNKNLVKNEFVLDVTEGSKQVSSKITYDYDQYNNPYKSILGFSKLLDQGANISVNNVVMTIVENTVVDGDKSTSSAKMYTASYKYDADNYPIEQVSHSSMNNPNYSKIQYLY